MNFIDAVKSVFNNYANFNGRARRSEYWWFFLFSILVRIVLTFVDAAIDSTIGIVELVFSLAILLPSFAVGVRRMHDVGKSGWYLLIPFYNLILACTNGQSGNNEYGTDPKGAGLSDDINAIGNN